jgi:hypothetical protein
MKFRIDVFTAIGTSPIGGPITEILGLSISEKINQVGQASITVPAFVAAERGLARGYRYKIYHESLGYLGVYKHTDSSIDASAKTITITAYDSLIGLAEQIAGFRRNYSDTIFSSVATSLFNTSLGWTVSYEGGATLSDKITFSVEGENYLRVADYLRQYVRGWFRRESDTGIRFGKFTSSTPTITFTAFRTTHEDISSSQALITQITRTRQGGDVVNRVYPVGAGIGETKLDLRYSNRTSPYTVQSVAVGGGSTAYYLQDSASFNNYGKIERVVSWSEIRPITNSAADLQNAANALYDIASSFLTKYKSENDAYTLSAVEVPSTLRVGDLIRVIYNGVAELETGNVGWLNIANNFYVTDISRSFNESGNASTSISIAANGEAVIGDTEVLYDILRDVQTLKLRTQPTQTYFSKTSDTIYSSGSVWGSDPNLPTAFFVHHFGNEVLALNEIYLEVHARQWFYPYGEPSSIAVSVSSQNAFSSTDVINSHSGSPTAINVSMSGQPAHNHSFNIEGSSSGTSGTVVYANDSSTNFKRGNAGTLIYNVSDGGSHSHTIDAHTHNISHGHTLTSQGSHSHTATVTLGAASPDTTTNTPRIGFAYTCGSTTGWINLDSGNTTLVDNTTGKSLEIGTYPFGLLVNLTGVQGYGIARVNITNILQNLDWRNNDVRFDVYWSRGRAALVVGVFGRVTIQPIAV